MNKVYDLRAPLPSAEMVDKKHRESWRNYIVDPQGKVNFSIPAPVSPIRFVLTFAALEGNEKAIACWETLQKLERGEAVESEYAKQLNDFVVSLG